MEFRGWPKMTRVNPLMVTISEKIDGTNACVVVDEMGDVSAQSRKRVIKVGDDNYGFASWVDNYQEELRELGHGYHFGEWAGAGIQSNPHDLESKHLFLFNTYRWHEDSRPDCCDVVPILYTGELQHYTIEEEMKKLITNGSTLGGEAEGIVVFHHASKSYTKHTIHFPEGKWCK